MLGLAVPALARELLSEDLPLARWLEHYAGVFVTVEVNNSFYRLPERSGFVAWRRQIPSGFLFSGSRRSRIARRWGLALSRSVDTVFSRDSGVSRTGRGAGSRRGRRVSARRREGNGVEAATGEPVEQGLLRIEGGFGGSRGAAQVASIGLEVAGANIVFADRVEDFLPDLLLRLLVQNGNHQLDAAEE